MGEIEVIKDDKLAVTENVPVAGDTESPVLVNPAMLSSGVVVRIVLITLLILYVAGLVTSLLSSLIHLIFLMVLSILFAYLIEPLVKLVQRPFENSINSSYMPKSLAIALAYLIVFSVLGIGIAGIAPLAVEQGKDFAEKLPSYATTIQGRFDALNGRYRYRLPKDLQASLTTKLTDFAGNLGGRITGAVGEFLVSLFSYLPWLI